MLSNQWLIHLGITLVLCVVASWVMRSVYRRVVPTLNQTDRIWDDAVLEAVYAPALVLIWSLEFIYIVATLVATYRLAHSFDISLIQQLIWGVVVLWFVIRVVNRFQRNLYKLIDKGVSATDKTTVSALSQLARITLFVIISLVVMQSMGISISALLAFGGVGGIALGFAAKDSLSNFLGGLMIYMDRPFAVGDWISSPDRKIEGTVEHIGWRLTRIITFDKRPLYVPNGVFSNISVENPSRMTNRRIKTTIGLRYQDADKLDAVVKAVEAMLRTHPDIDQTRTLMVNFIAFAESSLSFLVYTFTKTTHWETFQAVQQDVFLKIIQIVHEHKADFAFPTRTLDLPTTIKEPQ